MMTRFKAASIRGGLFKRTLQNVLIVGVFWALTSVSFAAPKPPPSTAPTIDLGEMRVEGKISKPQVFYVLGRRAVSYRGIKLRRDFVPRILASARTNPF